MLILVFHHKMEYVFVVCSNINVVLIMQKKTQLEATVHPFGMTFPVGVIVVDEGVYEA